MGMYDEVWLICPTCGEEYYEQSKSGPCKMDGYRWPNVPGHVLDGLMWPEDIFECEGCGSKFKVQATFSLVVVTGA